MCIAEVIMLTSSQIYLFFSLPLALNDPNATSKKRAEMAALVNSMAVFRLEKRSSNLPKDHLLGWNNAALQSLQLPVILNSMS